MNVPRNKHDVTIDKTNEKLQKYLDRKMFACSTQRNELNWHSFHRRGFYRIELRFHVKNGILSFSAFTTSANRRIQLATSFFAVPATTAVRWDGTERPGTTTVLGHARLRGPGRGTPSARGRRRRPPHAQRRSDAAPAQHRAPEGTLHREDDAPELR